jgi:hypothetical protein
MIQTMWDSAPNFEGTGNFKEFFLKHDALCNLDTQVSFSIFKRYMCKAGCKLCYVQKNWMPDENFGAYVPLNIPEVMEEKIINTWDHFDVTAAIDDLFFIKKNYPHIFDFYKRNSHRMYSSSMTDVALIQQHEILMSEMNFQKTYEITFSDVFLNRKDGTFVNDVISRLNDLHAKQPIQKIKFIIGQQQGDMEPNTAKLIEWAKENKIYTDIHDDILQSKNVRYDLKNADHQVTTMYSQNGFLFLILCEAIFMQYDNFFLTLVESIEETGRPFASIENNQFDPIDFIPRMVQAKIDWYSENVARMAGSCGNKYLDYYAYISNSANVNLEYNFIPKFMLKPYSKMFKKLIEKHTVEHQLGLIVPPKYHGTIIPIVSITAKPKIKLKHIPIKSFKGIYESV